MYEFRTETQGLHTFRVCTVQKQESLDTVGIGMLSNNNLKGLLSLTQMYMDNKCYLRYNISSKVTLQQYFAGKVNREKILKVFRGIVETILLAESYMLDVDLLLLQKDEIYVNVSDGEPELAYFPVLQAKTAINLPLFFKTILFETEFDQSENSEYVTSLLNFLNRDGGCTLPELKEMLEQLSKAEKGRSAPAATNTPAVPKPESRQERPAVPVTVTAQPVTAYIPPEAPIPAAPPVQQQEKKKGFSLFAKKESRNAAPVKKAEKPEKVKKEKKVKEKKKTADRPYIPAMEIPGMKAAAPMPSAVQAQPAPAPPTPSAPAGNPVQPAQAPAIAAQAAPVYQKSTVSFGETTVLHAAQAGETTVLGAEDQTIMQPVSQPYLIRKKTGEKIYINKPMFHMGKEKNYVDYCIADNSAVSRSHADIIANGSGYCIMDNNSLNHTYVNGAQIPSQSQIDLGVNSLIRLANEEFEFFLQ